MLCDICKEIINDDNWTVRLSDEKESIEFNGHAKCVDQLYYTIKNVKNLHSKKIKQVLDEINLRR